jgi:putative spermidine/putrescine transport system substrate-binding protein
MQYGPINKKAFDYIDAEVAAMLPTAPPYQGKTWIPNVDWWVERDQEIQEKWKGWLLE